MIETRFYNADHEQTDDTDTVMYFGYRCPKSNNWHENLPIAGRVPHKRDGQNQNGGIAQWDWDGNMSSPSFTPSIHVKGCCHGYITKGEWDDRGAG